MARQRIPLLASWYRYNGTRFSNWTPPTGSRPQLDEAFQRTAGAGNERYLENFTIRRDGYTVVLHAADAQTGSFQANEHLSTQFENNGSISIEYEASGTTEVFTVDLTGADTAEPYRIGIPAADQIDFETLRAAMSSTAGDQAVVLILDDGAADTTAPVLQSAETNTDGTRIALVYDEQLDDASVPATGDFTVGTPGTTASVGARWGGNDRIGFAWHEEGTGGNNVQVKIVYDGSQADGAVAFDTTSTATVIRLLCRGAISAQALVDAINGGRVGGEQLVVATLSGDSDGSGTVDFVPGASATLTLSGGIAGTLKAVSAVAVAARTVTLTVVAITEGETITLDYTPGTNPIQDLAGNDAAALSGQAVTNNVDTTAPTFQSAATDTDGTTVTLTFSEALDTGNVPASSAFTLSPTKAISNVEVSGSTVELTTAAFANGDTISVAYTQPASNRLQDAAGNEVATFAAQSVRNAVPSGPPPLGNILLDIDIPNTLNAAAVTWSGAGLVPASALRQDTAGDINITTVSDGTAGGAGLGSITITVPRFTAELEAGIVGLLDSDGNRVATFTLPGYSSTRYPKQTTRPTATTDLTNAELLATEDVADLSDSTLTLRIGGGLLDYGITPEFTGAITGPLAVVQPTRQQQAPRPEFTGTVSGAMAAQPTHNLTFQPQFGGEITGDFPVKVRPPGAPIEAGFVGSVAGTFAVATLLRDLPLSDTGMAGTVAGQFFVDVEHSVHEITGVGFAGRIASNFNIPNGGRRRIVHQPVKLVRPVMSGALAGTFDIAELLHPRKYIDAAFAGTLDSAALTVDQLIFAALLRPVIMLGEVDGAFDVASPYTPRQYPMPRFRGQVTGVLHVPPSVGTSVLPRYRGQMSGVFAVALARLGASDPRFRVANDQFVLIGETVSIPLPRVTYEEPAGTYQVSGLPDGLTYDDVTHTISGVATATAADYVVSVIYEPPATS